MSEWTTEDSNRAIAQGWGVFSTGRNRPFELQRVDESEVFQSDQAAWDFVIAALGRGDHLALRAERFLREHSPNEHRAIFGGSA